MSSLCAYHIHVQENMTYFLESYNLCQIFKLFKKLYIYFSVQGIKEWPEIRGLWGNAAARQVLVPPSGFRLPGSVENKAALFPADLRPQERAILSEKPGITKQEFVKCSGAGTKRFCALFQRNKPAESRVFVRFQSDSWKQKLCWITENALARATKRISIKSPGFIGHLRFISRSVWSCWTRAAQTVLICSTRTSGFTNELLHKKPPT